MRYGNQTKFTKIKKGLLVCASSLALVAGSSIASAQERQYSFDVEAQTLEAALMDVARQSGVQLMFEAGSSALLKVDSVRGRMGVEEALAHLLSGTNLSFTRKSGGVYVVSEGSGFQKVSYGSAGGYEAALAPSGQDESADRADAVEFETIVVTASRREQNLQDVPMAVSVVRPEEFTTKGLAKLDDVIAYIPGFTVNNVGQLNAGSINARGVSAGTGASTPVVGVYLDDVVMSENSPFASFYAVGNFFFDGLLGDVERVEFLKGPQGTLYGATSIGGAVRYITRKPSLEEYRGRASVDLSSTKNGGFNKTYSGRISAPIVEDRLGISVAGFYDDNNGYIDRVESGTGNLIHKDINGHDAYGFSGDLLFKISDQFDFRGRVLHQQSEWEGQVGVDLTTDRAPLYRPLTSSASFADSDLESTVFSGAFEYQFDGVSLISSSSYMKRDFLKEEDRTGLYGLTDSVAGYTSGTTTSVPSTVLVDVGKFSQEVRLASEGSENWEWFVGLYYTDETLEAETSIIGLGGPEPFNLFTNISAVKYEEYAAFGNLTYYITPYFDVTAGVRFAKNSIVLDAMGSGRFGGDDFVSETEDTVDTWMFSARYRPTESVSLYARAASGYRPATANVSVLGAPSFVRSDTLWSYEVGAKGNLADELISYDLAFWLLKWKDYQTTSLFGVTAAFINMDGGVTAKGVEGSFTIRPANGFSINPGFAYTSSTLDDDEPVTVFGLAGQQLPHVPKWTASVVTRYDFTLTSGLDAYIGGGLRYKGKVRTAFSDAGSFDLDNPSAGGHRGRLNFPTKAHIQIDLNAGIVKDNVALNVYVTNLLNDDSYSNILSNFTGSPNLNVKGFPVRPRTIGAVLSVDF
ncbi:TonB-dependent receptor domain-containing protein [Kordiimonas sp.]|uniref:TonB-dependent receptor domain-containing protein n=1 Tax=Kordiimonas sp. TaxID=1970157 RepID=UPI003A8D038D